MRNTLKYTKMLEEMGVPRNQAETHIHIMTEIIESDLATKLDIKDLRNDMKGHIVELKNDITQLRTELKNDIAQLEYRMTIKLGTIVTISLAALATIFKFF